MEDLLKSIENQIADLEWAKNAVVENIKAEKEIERIKLEISALNKIIEDKEEAIKKLKELIKDNNELISKIDSLVNRTCSVIVTDI